ncbi:hypothetical protein JCM10213_007159 [Rhodosporidiobolus nylandii]
MAKKNANKTAAPAETSAPVADSSTSPTSADAPAAPAKEHAPKVNTANLTELKTAVDDVVREFFSLPDHRFTRSHLHEDVRLALGWTAVAVAGATGWYGYKTEFHDSKQLVGAGVAIYVLLNTILALYIALVEKNTIFLGKRRTFASRITTERLTLSSLASSSPTHSTTSSWVPFPISLLLPSPAPSSAPTSDYPLYTLTLSYTHSSNANKSLLHANEIERSHPLAGWFDAEGRMARRVVEEWLEEGLREVVGAEGGKEE